MKIKKTMLLLTTTLCICVAAALVVQQNSAKSEAEMRLAANIEALANNELNPCDDSSCCYSGGDACYYKSTMGDGKVTINNTSGYEARLN